jgi:type IV secretion system protein VirB8
MARDPALEAYFEAARSWDDDRVAQIRRSARRAWQIAGVAIGCAALALIAVLALTPLKQVQPYLIRVDNSSGIVDVVPAYQGGAEISQLVTRHLLNAYVTARERYFYAMAEADYDTVGAYNTARLNQLWSADWDRNNARSPLNLYKDGTTVRAQVRAITFLKRANGLSDLAQIRLITAARPGGAGAEQLSHWIVTLQYGYGEPSKDERLRALNPLGLRILDYRREPEIVDVPPASTASLATTARLP